MNSSEPERPAIRVPSDSIPVSIAVCFFLSGLAGLVYEVVWARQLALFLGITSYAHAAVITAYMAGLAAGSVYFGRQADRHPRPLLVYAWLELGVGAYAALTPWLFPALQAAYTAWVDVGSIGEPSGHAVRFTISLLALLLPTFLMGGTLPLLVKGCTTSLPALGRFTGSLYGINTLGAVSGTLLAGFVLLPAAGVTATIYTGAAVNIAIALFVLFVFHPPETKNAQQPLDRDLAADLPAAARLSVTARIGVPLAFAMAGFAALLTQLAWIRVMILVVGGSVYAFTVTLASFLGGLGLGSLLYARLLTTLSRRRPKLLLRERMALAALLAILTSLGLLLGLPLVAKFPDWFMAAFAAGLKDSFALYQLFIFALSCCLMILPTLLMGALFPLVTTIWTTSGERAGRGIGSVYAMNTAGTILGASLGGVLILPWLGAQDSVRLAASLYLLVAAAFWLMSGAGRGSVFRLCLAGGLAGAVGAIVWLMPPWDRALITSGVFYQSENLQRVMQQQPGRSLEEVLDDYELLFFEEGADATVAVRRMRGEDKQRTLVINGKADASSVGDLPTQVLLAQLPLSINPGAMNILVIGLGSGITAGSLSSSESLRSMTVLEISAEVVEASALFAPENRNVLEDPRVNLVTADARNYLMVPRKQFPCQ